MNTTIAQQIAERFGNDGQNWLDAYCTPLTDVLRDHMCDRVYNCPTFTERYEFKDGSAILVSGDCWDLESTTTPWLMQCAE